MSEKSNRIFSSICIIFILLLVPVSQVIPFNLPSLPSASAQPWYGASLDATAHNSITGTSVTISNFNVGTNINRLLVVAVEANNHNVASITFGGKALKEAVGSFYDDDTEIWYLTQPNGTYNIVVTMTGSTGIVAHAYAFSKVDEANPIPTTVTNHTAVTPVSANPNISLITEYSNSYVIDSASTYGGANLTSSSSCTPEKVIQISGQVTGASSSILQASAGKVTCTWTNGATNGWDAAAIEIKSAGAAPPVTPITLNGKSTASGVVNNPYQNIIYKFNPGTGSNRLLVVGIEANNASVNAGSVTFGGVALTKAVSSFTNNYAALWYLKNPSSTPANISVTFTGSTAFVIGAYAFSGVNQTSPIPATKTATGSGNPSISITTANPNDWILDSPSIYGGSKLSSPTCTQHWDSQVPITSTSKITGASSSTLVPVKNTAVTCAWTNSVSTNNWDDVAIEMKGVSLTASTGILIPLYVNPYTNSSCHHPSCFAWNSINKTKNNYTSVPIFVIINPDSGSCAAPNGRTCPDPQYQQGIANLTKSGVIVLGYTYTSGGSRALGPPSLATSAENDTSNYTKWYQPYGLNGIMFDQFQQQAGSETYYSNLTNYVHNTNHLTYALGNPGAFTNSTYVNSGSADELNIYENNVTLPTTPVLQINTFSSNTKDLGFDKHDFSLLVWNVTKANFPNNATLGNYSNYVGLYYITDNCGHAYPCTASNANPWGTISPYLTNMTKALNHTSSIITINSTDSSGNPITGALIQINQTGNSIPSGYTPYSFLGTQTVKYLFTPQNYGPSCTFHNWKNGTSTAARTVTVNSTSAAFTVVYSGTGCP